MDLKIQERIFNCGILVHCISVSVKEWSHTGQVMTDSRILFDLIIVMEGPQVSIGTGKSQGGNSMNEDFSSRSS